MTALGWLRPKALGGTDVAIAAGEGGVVSVTFVRGESMKAGMERAFRGTGRPDGSRAAGLAGRHLGLAIEELNAYFAGELERFSVPVDLDGQGTPFQRRVWRLLLDIPYGTLVSYGDIAGRLGQPASARAVGGAVGRNPVPILVPCHRVVGSSGRLVGFSSGLGLKVVLLGVEGVSISSSRALAARMAEARGARRADH